MISWLGFVVGVATAIAGAAFGEFMVYYRQQRERRDELRHVLFTLETLDEEELRAAGMTEKEAGTAGLLDRGHRVRELRNRLGEAFEEHRLFLDTESVDNLQSLRYYLGQITRSRYRRDEAYRELPETAVVKRRIETDVEHLLRTMEPLTLTTALGRFLGGRKRTWDDRPGDNLRPDATMDGRIRGSGEIDRRGGTGDGIRTDGRGNRRRTDGSGNRHRTEKRERASN